MRHMRLVSAAAGTALLAAVLVGCGGAEDKLKEAGDKASSMGADATGKAGDMASDASGAADSALSDATGGAGDGKGDGKGAGNGSGDGAGNGSGAGDGSGGSGDGSGSGGGDITVEYGEFDGDPAATAAGEFFQVRQEGVVADGDTSALGDVATDAHLPSVTSYVESNAGKTGPYLIKIVGVDGDTVSACIGPKGTRARTVTIEGDKVADNVAGTHTCA